MKFPVPYLAEKQLKSFEGYKSVESRSLRLRAEISIDSNDFSRSQTNNRKKNENETVFVTLL